MKKLPLKKAVKGIRKQDERILAQIYREVFDVVSKYVLNNGGTLDDAKDVFQEAIIVVYEKIMNNSFEIHAGIDIYVMGISRKLWLRSIRNKAIHEKIISDLDVPEYEQNEAYIYAEDRLKNTIFRRHFLQLGKNCQQLLQMRLNNDSYDKIANKLSLKNDDSARVLKSKCKNRLIAMIKKDPQYIQHYETKDEDKPVLKIKK